MSAMSHSMPMASTLATNLRSSPRRFTFTYAIERQMGTLAPMMVPHSQHMLLQLNLRTKTSILQ
jgi:hypothetical protein